MRTGIQISKREAALKESGNMERVLIVVSSTLVIIEQSTVQQLIIFTVMQSPNISRMRVVLKPYSKQYTVAIYNAQFMIKAYLSPK